MKKIDIDKNCMDLLKSVFKAMTVFSFNVLSENSLECISVKNQREEVINLDTNNSMFCLFSVKVKKCSENCNNISDPYLDCMFQMLLKT